MRGMMTEHGMNPDDYLAYVHHIDHSPLEPNPALGAAIEKLPGRKLILTNGTRAHADAVMRRLDIHMHFEDVFGINEANLEPKPLPQTYDKFLKTAWRRSRTRRDVRGPGAQSRRAARARHDDGAGRAAKARARCFARTGRWKAATPRMSITSPTIWRDFCRTRAVGSVARAALTSRRPAPTNRGLFAREFSMSHVRSRQDHRRRLRGAQRRQPGHQGRGARRGRDRARPARQGRGARRREAGERQVAGQPVAQEGGAALVPPQRHGPDRGRARRRDLVGQGAVEVRGLGREPLPGRGLPRRAGRDRAPLAPTSRRTSC